MLQAMSLFSQLLQHFPSLEFGALVKKHNAERGAKGFSCRTQLVAMLFCQLAHADSLREICNGLACCLGKLVHLGIGCGSHAGQIFEKLLEQAVGGRPKRGMCDAKDGD
jgi:hypothetical protein